MSGPNELFISALERSVRFKVLHPNSAYEFAIENEDLGPDEFKIKVLNTLIYNFRTEVIPLMSEEVPEEDRPKVLEKLYRSCVSLNPPIDMGEWQQMTDYEEVHSASANAKTKTKRARKPKAAKPPAKNHQSLSSYLKERVIGQEEAVEKVVNTMKREFAGLSDDNRPMGVFLFAGASGIGKTLLAEELHRYLFDGNYDLVRIDCGEYQHKHENQKLTGAPPGYTGHEDGGQLTNRIINNPESVVLIDEVEKAHPDIMNTFLRVFDDGVLTDSQGRRALFNKAIIIMTTNLGNADVSRGMLSRGVGFGSVIHKNLADAQLPARESVIQKTDQAIRDHFKPEVLNRIDKVVVFNHLKEEDFRQIAEIELNKVSDKLSAKGYRLVWNEDVISEIIKHAANPVFGARGIARLRRDKLEDGLAELLLDNNYPKGTTFQVVHEKGDFFVTTQKALAKESDGTTE